MTQERWLPVPGFEGLYEVSNHGRVRSRRRKGSRGGILRASPDGFGYPLVGFYRGGRRVAARRVHSLVAQVFIGPMPEGHEVRHLDGDPSNCRVANLSYGTRLMNMADQRWHGTNANTRKTHCPHGHPYDEANTYVNAKGHRQCRKCRRRQQRGRR